MSDQTEPTTMEKARYEASVRALEFEIEQFWKRSLFFWGFIGAALVAFSAADKHSLLQGVIASFGFVCSVVWTLANRGSKFWYESWEDKRIKAEIVVTGELYGKPGPEKHEKECPGKWLKGKNEKWLQGRRYSPSKLTIVLSDYVAFLWFGLLVSKIIKIIMICPCLQIWHILKNWSAWFTCIFMVFSILYGILWGLSCHHKDKDEDT
jgi:hypothetical protein